MKITKKTVEVFVDHNGGEHETMRGAVKASYRTLLVEMAGTKDEIAVDRLLSNPHKVLDLFQAYIDATGIVRLKDMAKGAKTDANDKLAPSDGSGAGKGETAVDDQYAGTTAHGV